MNPRVRQLLWLVWALLLSAGCWYSFLPGAIAGRLWWSRYADHGAGFFFLGLVGVIASRGSGRAVILVSFFIGLLIELIQTGVPGRHFEVVDLLEDALGLSLGWLLASALRRRPAVQAVLAPASRNGKPAQNENPIPR